MTVRFGAFQLDAGTRQVFGPGGEVHLSPKAFDLLRLLVAARPRALSKADLQAAIWPTTFVSEANLPLLVGEIRSALGDTASTSRFIRTVPRFGYAFTGQAVDVAPASASPVVPQYFLVLGSERLPLATGRVVLGRDPGADVRIDAAGVSRLHARLQVTAVGVTLEDLGSKNGTYLRGARIDAPSPLRDGDEFRLGLVPLTLRRAIPSSTTETQQATAVTDVPEATG